MASSGWLSFLVLSVTGSLFCAFAETPAALLLGGDGAFRKSAPDSRWSALEPGAEIYQGDFIESRQGSLTLAICPGGDYDPRNSVVDLRSGGAVRLFNGWFEGRTDLVAKTRALPICVFPSVARDHRAAAQQFPPSPDAHASALTSDQRRALDLANSMGIDRELWRVSKITRAALLERFHRTQDAIAEYREIRDASPETTLTRERISSLGSATLPEASPAPNSLISRAAGSATASAPALVARTRTAEAPGVTDVEPDFSKGEQYALVIGISDYPEGQGVSKLNFASLDAETFATYLESERGGKLPKDHIWKLTDETDQKATRDAIEKALVEFVQGKQGPANTLIVFVAGHGRYVCLDRSPDATDGCDGDEEPFIVVHGGGTQAPNISGYPMRRLREIVTRRAAEFGRVLVFVDVCHGANVTWKGADQTLVPKEVVDALHTGGNHLGILSASALVRKGDRSREYAYESPDLKHGVFTYYLLRGMNGDAAPIDNKIVFSTLASTVQLKVQSFTHKFAQTPLISDHTNELLAVVDNAASPLFNLDNSGLNREQTGRGTLKAMAADPPSPEELRLLGELAAGHLLEPDGASSALQRIADHFHEDAPVYLISRDRYRVALEDRGQQTILRYLEGDQDPIEKSEFDACGDLFAAALRLAPDAEFDESRMLFCRGRALLYPDPDKPYGSRAEDSRFARAALLLERSIRIDPRRSYSYNALGIGYLERGDYPAASAAFRDAIRYAPYWAYPRHNLALTFSQEGRYQDALGAYKVAMAAGPDYSYLPYNAGLLYQQMADLPQAKSHYRDAERLAKRRCEVRLGSNFTICAERAAPRTGLASLEAAKGKKKNAEQLFLAALRDAPEDRIANHDLAFLLSSWRGREPEAETRWKQNLDAPGTPAFIPSLIGYSELLSRQCRFAEAAPLYRQIVGAMPEYIPAQLGLARALIRVPATPDVANAALAEAKPILEKLVAARPLSVDVLAAWAQYLEASGQPASAAWAEALRRATTRETRRRIVAFRARTGCKSK